MKIQVNIEVVKNENTVEEMKNTKLHELLKGWVQKNENSAIFVDFRENYGEMNEKNATQKIIWVVLNKDNQNLNSINKRYFGDKIALKLNLSDFNL